MNYIKHLAGFFDKVSQDSRLNPTHISLYISLFQSWNLNRFQNPISISRSEMMRVSKISANATYHKVIKQLHEYGYIVYEPSYNPFKGSMVHLVSMASEVVQQMNRNNTSTRINNEQAANGHHIKTETSDVQALAPSINNTNISNSKQAYEPANENTSSDFDGIGKKEKKNDQSSENIHTGRGPFEAVKETSGRDIKHLPIPRSLHEVQQFFEEEKSTKREAEKFFNYFQSNGWKVGGRAPMKDWHAAGRNWILNASKFESKPKPTSLHSPAVTNYAEPL